MTSLELTPIDTTISENVTVVKFGVKRTWKIITLILGVISLTLLIIVSIGVLKPSESCASTDQLTTTITMVTSREKEIYLNSSTDTTTSTGNVTGKSEEETTIIFNLIPLINPLYHRTFSLSTLRKLPTSVALSLDHSLYYNIPHFSKVQGYITSVTLRLYTNWEGNDPLYLYIFKDDFLEYDQITHRYPVTPKRNNTDWQTIEIPSRQLPIFVNNYVGVGMQTTNTRNHIYALNSTISIHGENITSNTQSVFRRATEDLYGVAFTYTILQADETLIH